MKCRHCCTEITLPLIDLGSAPPSNAYLTSEKLQVSEKYFPLRVLICTECWLVQTEEYGEAEELFLADYAYFSSFSTTLLEHCRHYQKEMARRFNLNSSSHVVEVAANDGYLLQYFLEANIPCLGIEPTTSTANAARAKGVAIEEVFFGKETSKKLASEGKKADLTIANNVLAHVPDINDFVKGFEVLLKDDGVATFEFPHLQRLVDEGLFDLIYHEHYSYLSLMSVHRIFEVNGLAIFDIDELATHGGSYRIFAQKKNSGMHPITPEVAKYRKRENDAGLNTVEYYAGLQLRANQIKNDFNRFLIDANNQGMDVVGYGAAAKGTTLLNYAGVRPDLLKYVVDLNPAKSGNYLPGCRIPIFGEADLKRDKPDYVIILPWNLNTEVKAQLSYIREWGGKFVTCVPCISID